MRKPAEYRAGYNGHGKTENDIASVVRLVGPVLVSRAVVTRDTDADQRERRQRDHHSTEDQQRAVVVHARSMAGMPLRR